MAINNDIGYLYIRINELYQKYESCKFGITECIVNRDNVYSTGEIKRGYFELVIQIPKDKMKILEKLLQNYFKSLRFTYNNANLIKFITYPFKRSTQIENQHYLGRGT
mgnify:CR=1 FL=1